jgi:hypothetical protein
VEPFLSELPVVGGFRKASCWVGRRQRIDPRPGLSNLSGELLECLITELSRFSDSVRDLRYPIIRLITRLSESLTTFRAPARILHNGASVHERGHRRYLPRERRWITLP